MAVEGTDAALLSRADALAREAAAFARDVGLHETLAPLGRVVPVGSTVTGLMVWRDVDVCVDAPRLERARAFEALLPLLARAHSVKYVEDDPPRHYFVLRIGEWKVDLSLFVRGLPPEVEAFQDDLRARLDDELRLAILRLKDAWWPDPAYPEVVSGFEIYEAVLDDGVRTLDELDAWLAARGLPTRGR